MALFRAIARLLTGGKPAAPASDSLEQESSWDPSKSWYSSEEEELEERAQEQVWESLEDAKVSSADSRQTQANTTSSDGTSAKNTQRVIHRYSRRGDARMA